MTRYLFVIPETEIESCPHCTTRGGTYNRNCRACMARDVARMPHNRRREWYRAAAEISGELAVRCFLEDVSAQGRLDMEAKRA